MVRNALVLLVAGMAWSPAQAQVASVAVFGPMPEPSVSFSDGARTSAASEFSLYELGAAGPGAVPASMRAGEDLATVGAQGWTSRAPAVRPLASVCGASAVAPPRLLGAHIAVSRHAFWPLIASAECRYGLPSGLMDSVVLAESGYDPFIVSAAGAAGLSQLMPATAADLGVTNRFDASENVLAGARYLRRLLDGFGGNIPLALAAYNAGPAAVRRFRGIPVNGETPGYVRRVLGLWAAPGIGPISPLLSARQTAQMLGFTPGITN